ncbi:beta strand repeat-containing protein, partial [Aquabacterium sp.]|uniref:beta strand repeat-containing protein n=1 Tax=Aquabacterium sp. TaxID=1872578 RepID=UPI003D6C9DEB
LQLGAPGAPIVTIGEDANNDGYISKAELSGNIDVSVTLPATAKAGDSLLVSANGTAQPAILLTQADIDKGSVSVPNITNPGEGSTLTVTAQVKDVAGNLGATGSDSAIIDTTPATVLTAQLDPTSDSGTKGDGITNDATPTISGTGEPGAQIKVTLPSTNEVLTTTVQPNGTWAVTPTQDIPNGTTGQAQVTETDAAGNSVQTNVPLTIDTGVPNNGAAPTVTITEDANNDGYINKAELNGNVDVKVAFTPAQVNVGDVVKVTSGGMTNDVTITAQDKANGFVTTSFVPTVDGTTITVTANIVDKAGNASATGSDSAVIDTTRPTVLTAQLDPASDSGVKGDGVTNDATPTISGTGDPGSQIKVSLPGTNEVLTTTVLPNGSWTVTPTQNIPNGTTGQAQVTETDAAGNTTQTTVPLAIDTGVPNNGDAPVVTITEDANNDGFINKAELNGEVDVKVAFVPAQVSVGDVVKVTSDGMTKDVAITAADKANGFVTTSFTAPANGTSITVTSHIEDSAGNVSKTGTDEAKLDLSTLSGLDITLSTDANNDGFINKSELGGGNQVSALVKLPADAAAGDTLNITATGNATQAITLTPAQIIAGQVEVSLNAPASGTDLVVSAQVSDPAGNHSNVATDHAIIATDDISAPRVTITTDANNDGYINKAELGSGSTIAVAVELPATAKTGDSLLVSVNGAPQTPIVLTQADINNHTVVVPGITNPGEGVNLQVTAQIKDVAGNLGATGSDGAKIDTTSYSGLGISITTDGNNDGYISKAELTDNTIGVRVALPAGAAAGDTLTVTGSGNVAQVVTLTNAQLTAGFVDLKFNPTGDNTDFVSSASIADAAGNAAGPVSDAARLQLGAPGAPIVTIGEDANNDGFINKAELSGSIDVSVTLPATAKAGDSLLVSANGTAQTPILLTQTDIDKGSVVVPGITNPGEGSTLTVTAQV